MKTHVKLLVLALVLVMFTFCLAACAGGGNGDTTTTTAAPQGGDVTTTAPAATTTTAAGDLGYDPAEFDVVVDEEVPFTGKALDVVDALKPAGVRTTIKYAKIDANGNVIQDLGNSKPVDCGQYRVTVTFSWQKPSKTDPLPAPMSKDFSVVAGSLADQADNFGAADIEILYKATNMNFNPVESALATGYVPAGVVRSASIVKLAAKDDTSAGTPTAVAGKITSADGAGYFRVTLSYAEEEGKDNFNDENTVSHSAVVYARAIEKTAAKVTTAPAVDGTIEAAYGDPLFTTEYQPYTTKNASNGAPTFDKVDLTQLVDPYTKAAALRVARGAAISDAMERSAASAKFYVVWDGEFVYVAIEVTDTTPFARSADYTSQGNPWINDNLELYYVLGGDAIPDVNDASDTYPTYKTLVRDSRTGSQGFTGIGSQRSHYFDNVVCSVSGRDTVGDTTYVIEYKLPAKSESYSGTPGAQGDAAYKTIEGDALAAGDFIYLAYQLNDLMGLPYKRLNANSEYDSLNGNLSDTERWATVEEYDELIKTLESKKLAGPYDTSPAKDTKWYNFENDAAAYVYAAGNRSVSTYLKQPGCAPMIIQLGN